MVRPPLFDSTLIFHGPHELVVPIPEGNAVGEPEVAVSDSLVWLGIQIESSDEDLSEHEVESRPSI